jgi:hypothetical protein
MAKKRSEVVSPAERTELSEISAVLEYLAPRERLFEGSLALHAAGNLINARATLLDNVKQPFDRILYDQGEYPMQADLRNAWGAIMACYQQEIDARIVDQRENSVRVRTNFPIPDDTHRNELFRLFAREGEGLLRARLPGDASRLMCLLVAGVLKSWLSITTNTGGLDTTKLPANVWAAVARIEAYEFSVRWKKELIGEAQDAEREIGHVRGRVDAAVEAVQAVSESTGKAIADLEALSVRSKLSDERLAQLQKSADKQELDLDARYSNWATTTDERLKLRQAGKLWDSRARWARASWLSSFAAIALLILGVPSLAVWFREEILEFVRKVDPTLYAPSVTGVEGVVAGFLATASHLILISLPVAFLVWGIRFLIRFNMRSQLLMDDATQRRTMLETYFLLIEKGVADPKADRAVLLEALFRPPPGHGADAPEPLNLVDIAKLADIGSKKPD